MLAKRIIPCLDVMNGRVVKGVNFVNLRDAGDPVEQAIVYDREGADELIFLDITASHEARATTLEMARRVADSIFIPYCVGGGIRTIDDIRDTLLAGADKVSINSAAVRTPEVISAGAWGFGSQCIVVAIDPRRIDGKWVVHINGGRIPTDKEAVPWAKEVEDRGAGEILLTSMDKDGTEVRLRHRDDSGSRRRRVDTRDCFRRRGKQRTLPRSSPGRPGRRRLGRQSVSF